MSALGFEVMDSAGYPAYPTDARGWARAGAPEFTFDSPAEAADWTRSCWPHLNVDFTGMHGECLTPFLWQLHQLAARWPEVIGRLRILRPVPEQQYQGLLYGRVVKARGEVYAQIFSHHALELDPVHFGNPDMFYEALAKDAIDGWSPWGCGTIHGVASHEFGHLLDDWLTSSHWNNKDEPEHIPYQLSFSPYASMWSEFGLVRMTVARFKHLVRQKQLSGYASMRRSDSDSRAGERFAEGFASFIHTPVAAQNGYVKKLSALLSAVDRVHWRAAGEFAFLHTLDGDLQRHGVETLAGYAQRFGMKVTLLKPA